MQVYRVYNFSPGPATLPLPVLKQAQEELLNWHNSGMSVMEISHRSKEFIELAQQSEFDLRELLNIPDNYKILFLQGGARSQFAMVPMNLLQDKKNADYINTGVWSELAIAEAKKYCEVNIVASAKETEFTTIPDRSSWHIDNNAAYFHYVDNETVNGVEFPDIPETNNLLLVSDMSSNLLSRPFDVSRFAVIYAGAQKNIGPAGLTVVIVREDLIGKALEFTPSMFNYKLHADNQSMYNTPPTFAWYMAGLNFKWLKKQGGVVAISNQHKARSKKLYEFIDSNPFYYNSIAPKYRSRMNVIFYLRDEKLNDNFIVESTRAGLANLKGHKLVGGMRASLYNALPDEAVTSLIDFMKDFATRYG